MSLFQYQALAEPVLVPAPAAATVYLDWHVQDNLSWRPPAADPDAFTSVYVLSSLPINPEFFVSNVYPQEQHREADLASYDQIAEPFIAAITSPPRVRVRFTFTHDEDTKLSKNNRAHQQQVAKYLNQLLFSGELQGTPQDPSLGYQCDDPAAWNTVPPTSLKAAVDRIAAALKTLMGGVP